MVAKRSLTDYRGQASPKYACSTIGNHFQTIARVNRHKQTPAHLTRNKMSLRLKRPQKHDADLPELSLAHRAVPLIDINFQLPSADLLEH
jgi:hypothetical protein